MNQNSNKEALVYYLGFFYLFLSLFHTSYSYLNLVITISIHVLFYIRVFNLLHFYYPNNVSCFEFSVLALFSTVLFCNSCWSIMVLCWRSREIFNSPVSLCYGTKVRVNRNSSGSGKSAQGNEVDPSASPRQDDKGLSVAGEAEIH